MNIPGTDDTHLADLWLNPRIVAFTQPDPQTQLDNPANANAYRYAADNPTNYTDPTGMFSLLRTYALDPKWCVQGCYRRLHSWCGHR
jgi:hypothetical protein